MVIDASASLATMKGAIICKAKGALGVLCEFVGTQQWNVPWTRLVLYDVYVRTLMTYGAAVWTPGYLEGFDEAHTRSPLGQLAVVYRQGIRVLPALSVDIRMELVYILTLRWPLAVALSKATWRYYRRVRDMAASGDPGPLGVTARWAQA